MAAVSSLLRDADAPSLPLDGTAGGPSDLNAWTIACDEAASVAEDWPTALTSASGVPVKTGFVEGPYATGIRTVLWVQDFEASQEDRVRALLGPPSSVIANAPLWDATFQSAEVVGDPAPGVSTVSWNFSACPLPPRDLLYLFNVKEIGQRTAYVYPSVSDRAGYGKPTKNCCRVRAKNMFPSIDRIEKLPNGKIRLVHMITTRLGGLICDCCYNSCFESTVLQTYANEADKWRAVIDGDEPLT
eukprot:CAMPEP_0198502398 /NCGR_PEP_ID=MMETSP1462-20131121/9289_1 /TAXON_ID=1333877 /ORGANISM="Brandtodinium nutriculum, Strain RCC3387" /LENGTH=243 /DNA_ID=CAMNT_0044231481 /DNA_START=99 /DNA_END=830 /DNA_ORIENTATION=+